MVFTRVRARGLRASITAFHVVNFLVFCALIWFFACVFLNIIIDHSFLLPTAAPGTLISDRYTFRWFVYASHVYRIVPFSSAIWMLGDFRNSFARIIHLFIAIIGLGLEAAVLVFYGFDWSDCNDPSQPDNPCNDYRWCCLNFAANPTECSNVGPCAPVPATLETNVDFLLLFFAAVGFAGFWLIHLILNRVFSRAAVDVVARERFLGFDTTGIRFQRNRILSNINNINELLDEGGGENITEEMIASQVNWKKPFKDPIDRHKWSAHCDTDDSITSDFLNLILGNPNYSTKGHLQA